MGFLSAIEGGIGSLVKRVETKVVSVAEDPFKMGSDVLKLSARNVENLAQNPLEILNPFYAVRQSVDAARTLGGDAVKTASDVVGF